MTRRNALRDDEWERIKDLFPGQPGDVGVTAKDKRLFVEAVLYRYKTGIHWRDIPKHFTDFRVIRTRTDALGNLAGFYLTGSAAHDLRGSDELLDVSISQTWIANRAYDSDARVIELIKAVQGHAFIPSRCHRLQPRDLDKELYKARHLIENFFTKIKSYRAIATRYDKLAWHFLNTIHLVSCIIWLN